MKSENQHAAAVKFPPPILPIVTIVAGHLLGRFMPILSDYDLPTPQRYWIGGLIVLTTILGLIVSFVCSSPCLNKSITCSH